MYFIEKALSPSAGQEFDCSYKLNMPIIGIGAPVEAWLPKVAEKLHTELIIPEHAERWPMELELRQARSWRL
jgi:hypothetical protein